ncbi:rod shape-determining protein [Ohessyouella blattaphilus]|uniref:Cell shape-determining protein MreB n=1 Tax=Ohessyouella blattaphilus TaxID=2949333 RepID=A0ABT1EDC9_9FIRM|nr:rod shape-determining protein [Ohessyouella blattaphilus]MCP1108693.1 rod shape-determining protein [Ohessyouella blattaphilus]MCR8562087.1 rod shape-determining protein [Ohessyouella blattaphilus]MDL2249405.1 rod shape-determining protein [Lachnospiraceae bacterium OttesenSCG-928-J05]
MAINIGIDMGTSSTLIYVRGKGVVLKEPTIVAFDRDTNKSRAFGEEARALLERASGSIIAIRPLQKGAIADYTVAEEMLGYFISKALGRRTLSKPNIYINVQEHVTEVERKAAIEAAYGAGARDVVVVREPIAAAIGIGLDMAKPFGNMLVDIGGGTTDVAIVSLGGVVASESVKVAGNDMDEAILQYIKQTHDVVIGEKMAEDIKIKIGSAFPLIEDEFMIVTGRDVNSGLPREVEVTSGEIESLVVEKANLIIDTIISVLEQAPPEVSVDILERGIILTGGGSLLRGLDELIEERTGIHTVKVEEPLLVIAKGTGRYSEVME